MDLNWTSVLSCSETLRLQTLDARIQTVMVLPISTTRSRTTLHNRPTKTVMDTEITPTVHSLTHSLKIPNSGLMPTVMDTVTIRLQNHSMHSRTMQHSGTMLMAMDTVITHLDSTQTNSPTIQPNGKMRTVMDSVMIQMETTPTRMLATLIMTLIPMSKTIVR